MADRVESVNRKEPPVPGGAMSEPVKPVFLSYASQDSDAAQTLCDALRATDIEVWFDRSELRGGDAWDQKIRVEIRDCALFVPLISAHTAARAEGYFRLEWSIADARSHMIARNKAFIIPVCLDQTPESGADVPESFQRVQWMRLSGGRDSEVFVERMRRLLSSDPANPTATKVGAPATSSAGAASTRSVPQVFRSFVPWIVGGLLVIATAYLVANRFQGSKHGLPAAETPATASTQTVSVSDKSIAVLPFADLSEKHDQGYFADGMADEVTSLLSKIPQLKVIS